MSDLTDLEICEKIAKIVGCPYDDSGLIQAYGNWINPLLDTMRAKAFCLDLMIGHGLCIDSVPDGFSIRLDMYDDSYVVVNEQPNKAICLAIIKVNSND